MTSPGSGWVVVSGGAGALGSQLVSRLVTAGRNVLALDRQFDVPSPGLSASVDLASQEAVREALALLPAGVPISLLINAVGLIWNEPVLSFRAGRLAIHSIETWRRVIESNLTAPFVVGAEVAARMARSGGGSIVNVSSIAAGGNAGQVAYGAAKAGIESLTRTMATELGPLGIRCNALALGFIDASTTRSALSAGTLATYVERTPLGRLGALQDVYDAITFLEGSSFTNGAVLSLDGGLRF